MDHECTRSWLVFVVWPLQVTLMKNFRNYLVENVRDGQLLSKKKKELSLSNEKITLLYLRILRDGEKKEERWRMEEEKLTGFKNW